MVAHLKIKCQTNESWNPDEQEQQTGKQSAQSDKLKLIRCFLSAPTGLFSVSLESLKWSGATDNVAADNNPVSPPLKIEIISRQLLKSKQSAVHQTQWYEAGEHLCASKKPIWSDPDAN